MPEATSTISSRMKSGLLVSVFGLAALIVFGVLWFLLLAPANPNGAGWYLFSFAAGLTMIVLPCTLPLAFVIVPLSMGKGVLKGLGIALSFGLGITLVLSVYGIIAGFVGSLAINSIGAPLEAIKNWVYLIAGIFALVFALSEIGLMKVRMPSYKGSAPAFIQKRKDYLKAFLLGLFLGNIGVGCPHPATPLILIEIASSGSMFYGWTLFLVHAIGRVLPLLFLAFLGILGVNALSWLVERKDKIERVTGWGMVFVAGFILTLGLFTHDWWVNSGIHTQFEALTQEAKFNAAFNEQLGTDVAHVHGVEDGPGLFGLPLWLGNWFLVAIWVIPMWWWWLRKRKRLYDSPAMKLQELEAKIDKLEADRRQVESAINLDELEEDTDLKRLEEEIDLLERQRRSAADGVHYGEQGELKDPNSRTYEIKLLSMQKKYFIAITILLGLVFIWMLPHNFLQHQSGGHGDHGSSSAGIPELLSENIFSRDVSGLPVSKKTEVIQLRDGDTFDLTASIVRKEVGNRELKMLVYNGSVPGPVIKVDEGAEITINLTNNTDVETTLHSHGIRIDNEFDGVAGVTQDAIGIGETFTYRVKFPDAGVYWYHPHIREDYSQEHGLYGNYIVEPLEDSYWSSVNREVPIVVDDILIEGDTTSPFYRDFTNFALLGRFGNELLVNGEKEPVFDVQTGEVIRFQITNVANTRTFNLSIPGAEMKLVGADLGRYEQETFISDFIIAPAERVILEVHFPREGLYKLTHKTPEDTYEIGFFDVSGTAVSESYVREFNTLRRNLDVVSEFQGFNRYLSQSPDKSLLLTVDVGDAVIDHAGHGHGASGSESDDGHGHDDDHGHGMSGMMNNMMGMMMGSGLDSIQWDDPGAGDRTSTTEDITWKLIDRDTGKENMDIDWRFAVGDYVKVRMTNDMMADHVMQHPMHFHGQRFVVLARNDVPETNRAWKDTALVLPGETLDVLVEMSNSGVWMAHCHIAEHLHAGMMLGFRVEEEDGSAQGDEYRAGSPMTAQEHGTDEDEHIHDDSHPHDDEEVHVHDDSHPHEEMHEHNHGTFSIPDSTENIQFLENVIVGKYQVAIGGGPFEAHESLITFTIKDVFSRGIALEEFDGAMVHLTVINVETGEEIHAHTEVHDHGEEPEDGHHDDSNNDGHDHSHSFVLRAHAHVEDTGLAVVEAPFLVTFPEEGIYKLFVQFRPVDPDTGEIADEPAVVEFFVRVASHIPHEGGHHGEGEEGDGHDHEHAPVLTVPWYVSARWWTLFLTSLVLMAGLSLLVRKLLTVK